MEDSRILKWAWLKTTITTDTTNWAQLEAELQPITGHAETGTDTGEAADKGVIAQ